MKSSYVGFQALEHSELSRLMALYEDIYLCLRLLAPGIQVYPHTVLISHVPGNLDLHLRVLERSRFTTTLNLTYCFHSAPARQRYEPDLTIRLYHDAQAAEAMSGLLHGVRHERRQTRSLWGRWQLNRFLLRWLRYCLHKGHRFEPLPERVLALGGPAERDRSKS